MDACTSMEFLPFADNLNNSSLQAQHCSQVGSNGWKRPHCRLE